MKETGIIDLLISAQNERETGLFEKKTRESIEIESPVSPLVAMVIHKISVLETGLRKCRIQLVAALEEEISIAASDPVKLDSGILESGSLLHCH